MLGSFKNIARFAHRMERLRDWISYCYVYWTDTIPVGRFFEEIKNVLFLKNMGKINCIPKLQNSF